MCAHSNLGVVLSAFIEWVPKFYLVNEHDISPFVLFPWLMTVLNS
jgi:hypothetical protein